MSIAPDCWHVRADRPAAYDVIKTPHLFHPDDRRLLALGREGGRRFVVMDARVAHFHGDKVRAWFRQQQLDVRIVVVPGGEEHKTLALYEDLLRELDAFPIHRRDEPIIAIGGGVLTDVVAFVAASHRRGVPHIKIPTTLMGYVDAALGLKTGINFNGHKNRLGSFEPPLAVFLDRTFLATLPRRHLVNGLCEIIKLAIVCDAALFERLEAHGAASLARHFGDAAGDAILDHAIDCMLAELVPNLYETELARRVDFGHTFSYGLEIRHEGRLLHGEAVLLDMLVSVCMARARGLLQAAELERVFALIERLGILPELDLLDAALMWDSLQDRTTHRNGLQRVPVPAGLGRCVFLNDVSREELGAALDALHAWMKERHEPAL